MGKLNADATVHSKNPLQNLFFDLQNRRDVRDQADAILPPMYKEGIAIIGIGCRFPGGVNNAEAFWKLLVEGREAVSEVPPDRWNVGRF